MASLPIVLLAVFCVHAAQAAVFNTDIRYAVWPKIMADIVTRIPVYIEVGRYDAVTLSNIQSAINRVNVDLNGCVSLFQVYTTTPGYDFLWISNVDGNGILAQHCASVPGLMPGQNGRGQRLIITTGSGRAGVCGASIRGIMGALVDSLGLRAEYRRPDRAAAVTVTEGNLDPFYAGQGYYTAYEAGRVDTLATAFDFNSVTMVQRATHAVSGAQVLTTTPVNQVIGEQMRLSVGDCEAIKSRYTCPVFFTCQDPYGSGGGTGPLVPGGGGGTGPLQPDIGGGTGPLEPDFGRTDRRKM